MLCQGKRPRELHWYHAGPMLFGDWGTSRLYVLGLAFYYTRHASLWFMLAMSVLLVAVGWAYQIVCRVYPDGGGVYSSARHRSQSLAVIGGLLLCADYLVTAAISTLDAFHYLNVARPQVFALGSLVLIGVINYFGPKKSGTIALGVALLTIILTFVLGLFAVPYLGQAHVSPPHGGPLRWWTQFTSLILAISGVEAIANMTGLMVEPVDKTAARSIWPVVCEIVVLNLVLTLAMLAMPLDVLGGGNAEQAYSLHRDDMLRALAEYYVGPVFAIGSAVVFAMLLLSAANTALADLVSIQFMMSRDGELPAAFGLLNSWGMPVVPLVVATAVPVAVLMAVADVEKLADLYAIGVVGAVAINLGTCSTNSQIELKRYERWGMGTLAILMIAIWITVAYEKPHALMFAFSVLAVGLTTRFVVNHRTQARDWVLAELGFPPPILEATALIHELPANAPVVEARKRILVATRGSLSLFRFALEEAKGRGSALDVLFVRHLAVPVLGSSRQLDLQADPSAQHFLLQAVDEANAANVPVRCLYVVARDVAKAILRFVVECEAEAVVLRFPRQSRFRRIIKGDVVSRVKRRLPEGTRVLIQS